MELHSRELRSVLSECRTVWRLRPAGRGSRSIVITHMRASTWYCCLEKLTTYSLLMMFVSPSSDRATIEKLKGIRLLQP